MYILILYSTAPKLTRSTRSMPEALFWVLQVYNSPELPGELSFNFSAGCFLKVIQPCTTREAQGFAAGLSVGTMFPLDGSQQAKFLISLRGSRASMHFH